MKTLTQRAGLLAGLVLAATLLLLPTWAAGQDQTPTQKQDAAGQDKAPANKQDATKSPPKGLRVFFASHSLMWYVPNVLNDVAAAAGIKDHKLVGLQSIGGSKTLQHWTKAEGQNTAKKALRTGAVDVFVMSPIQIPDEGIDNFVNLGLEHNKNMRFHVQVSWGAWDTDMQTFPKGSTQNVDRNKTPEQLKKIHEVNIKAAEDQADAINKKVGKKVVFLVPSAQATMTLRTRIHNKDIPGLTSQGELFADAISHPTAPLQTLNTYLHFAALYDYNPVGFPLAASFLKNSKKAGYDEKLNRALQEIAWDTISKYPYSYPYHAIKEAEVKK